MAEPLVLINAFEVPAAEAEKFIAAWEQSRDCAQEFLAATQSLGFRQAAAGLADYRPHPGLVSGCAHLRTAADLLDVRPGDTVRTAGGRLDGARAMRIGTYTGESCRPVLDLRHRALPRDTCG